MYVKCKGHKWKKKLAWWAKSSALSWQPTFMLLLFCLLIVWTLVKSLSLVFAKLERTCYRFIWKCLVQEILKKKTYLLPKYAIAKGYQHQKCRKKRLTERRCIALMPRGQVWTEMTLKQRNKCIFDADQINHSQLQSSVNCRYRVNN